MIGLHRPEFEFEKAAGNVARFLQRNQIGYPVGLDNTSAAWHAWGVESWPTHFLVPRPLKVGAELLRSGDPHVGDRAHDDLERRIVDILAPRAPTGGAAAGELASVVRVDSHAARAERLRGSGNMPISGSCTRGQLIAS